LVIAYLDTSAAMKLLVEESESAALAAYLGSEERLDVVASWLLHTELHCAANRHRDDIDTSGVGVVLDTITLVDLTRGDLMTRRAARPTAFQRCGSPGCGAPDRSGQDHHLRRRVVSGRHVLGAGGPRSGLMAPRS
jgi:hypothetical protein